VPSQDRMERLKSTYTSWAEAMPPPMPEPPRKRARKEQRGPLEHGKPTSYTAGGCRCDACRTAAMAHRKQRRAERLAAGDFTHGTRIGYHMGCRCTLCKQEAKKRREEKKRRQEPTLFRGQDS
jgi:hypothetical protein